SKFVSSFFFQAEDGIRDFHVTGVQTCALPILFNVTGLKALLFLETLSVSIAKESFNSLISSAILASTFLVSQLTAIIPNAKRAIKTFFISFQFYFWI